MLLDGLAPGTRRLHLLEAHGAHTGQGPGHILLQVFTHAPELETDGPAERALARGFGDRGRQRRERRHSNGHGGEEVAAGGHGHLASMESEAYVNRRSAGSGKNEGLRARRPAALGGTWRGDLLEGQADPQLRGARVARRRELSEVAGGSGADDLRLVRVEHHVVRVVAADLPAVREARAEEVRPVEDV